MLKNIHFLISKMCALSPQSCLTLCSPMHYSLPGSSDHGIFPARILEWGAFPFSMGLSQSRDQTPVSCVSLLHWQTDSLPPVLPEKPSKILQSYSNHYNVILDPVRQIRKMEHRVQKQTDKHI